MLTLTLTLGKKRKWKEAEIEISCCTAQFSNMTDQMVMIKSL